MNVFVTGASGFVGQEIVHELLQQHDTVRLLTRKSPSQLGKLLSSPGAIEIVAGDLLDVVDWPKTLKGIDAVIHLVGIISEQGRNTFQRVHVEATRNLIQGMMQAQVKRLVHMSALGTRPGAASNYHLTKWQAEELVRNSGLNYTIFRPSIIYGPQDQFMNLFNRISRLSPFIPVMGKGQGLLQPIHVNVVAKAFVRAINQSKSEGATIDLCGTERFTFCEIIDQMLHVKGRKRYKIHIPLSFAQALAACCEWSFPRLMGQAPPLNRDQLIMLQEDNIGDAQTAHELFQLPEVHFSEGIAAYL